jgi:2-dehydropantoate 2-reductase
MRICIYGAGAIGGFLAARLALGGHDVVAVARGAQLEAIGRRGLTLIGSDGRTETATGLRAAAGAAGIGAVDVLVITLKAHQLPPLAAELGEIGRSAELIVPIQNGVPWWYFHRHGGPHDGRPVAAVDPEDALARHLDVRKVAPALAFKAAEVVEPGVIRHKVTADDHFPIGELDGSITGRLRSLSAAFGDAALDAPVVTDIRARVWSKLLGNLAVNPIGALTGATVAETATHPLSRSLCLRLMEEALAVAAALGAAPDCSAEARLRRAEGMHGVKASMLQDRERGRPMEVGSIVGAVAELAALAQVPVPTTHAIHACLALLADRAVRLT